MARVFKEGSETYVEDDEGRRFRVNVYGRQKAFRMFKKQVEDLTEEEIRKFLKD